MKKKVLVLIPTNADKTYCIAKFLKNFRNIEMNDYVLFSDDTYKSDEYKNTIESLGYEVVKVEKTIQSLKAGYQLDIRECLVNAREALRQEFLKRKEFQYAMWFDSDIIMPKETIPQLLTWKKEKAILLNGSK